MGMKKRPDPLATLSKSIGEDLDDHVAALLDFADDFDVKDPLTLFTMDIDDVLDGEEYDIVSQVHWLIGYLCGVSDTLNVKPAAIIKGFNNGKRDKRD